ALRELMEDKSVATLVYVFDGMLMFLELAAIIGKSISFVPMTYATTLAEVDLVRAHATAERLARVAGGSRAPPPDEPSPDHVSSGPAPVPRPPRPSPLAQQGRKPSERHAPRWRPESPSNGAGAEVEPRMKLPGQPD